jgi:hypothetical protein
LSSCHLGNPFDSFLRPSFFSCSKASSTSASCLDASRIFPSRGLMKLLTARMANHSSVSTTCCPLSSASGTSRLGIRERVLAWAFTLPSLCIIVKLKHDNQRAQQACLLLRSCAEHQNVRFEWSVTISNVLGRPSMKLLQYFSASMIASISLSYIS